MRRFLALVLLLGACVSGPMEPTNGEPFQPPVVYVDWWEEVHACVGRTHIAPFSRVSWFLVPGGPWPGADSFVGGLWAPPHKIYIADTNEYREDLVKHEMLHDLGFRHPGVVTHPYPWPFAGCAHTYTS